MAEDKTERNLPTNTNGKLLKLSVTPSGTLPQLPLPNGVTYDYINCKTSVGLSFHILESGYDPSRPLLLLLHEFPGLAYSWRKIMPALASANYYVVAVDQRGYGRTTGWDCFSYDATNLDNFSMRQYVADMVALVYGLGYKSVRCIVGHDFGAAVASMCALMRPDFFKSCVLISTPFSGVEGLPIDSPESNQSPIDALTQSTRDRALSMSNSGNLVEDRDIHFALAQLSPPRKHYRWYNAFHGAASDYRYPPQGLNSFLRGFFHVQSAHMKNKPQPLDSWTAAELSKLPTHYVMPLNQSMPETIAAAMDKEAYEQSRSWLSDEELGVYVQEFARTGFQGALNYFRVDTDQERAKQLTYLAGARMEVPVIYIGGNYDWGNFEDPGILQLMPKYCRDFRGIKIIEDAGHWPQQEQPGALTAEILMFLWNLDNPRKSPKIGTSKSPPLHSTPSPEKLPKPPTVGTIFPPKSSESPAQMDRTIEGQLQRRSSQSQPSSNGRIDSGITMNPAKEVHLPSRSVTEAEPHTSRIRGAVRKSSKSRTSSKDPVGSSGKEHVVQKPGYNFNPPIRRKPTDPDTPHPDVPEYNTEYPLLSAPIERPLAPTPENSIRVRKDTPIVGPGYQPEIDFPQAEAGQRNGSYKSNGNYTNNDSNEPMSPGGMIAMDASERNAEIYKQVSEQARQKLADAEKQFRRMGREPRRRNYSEDGSRGAVRPKEYKEDRDGKTKETGLAPSERRATPFEADMEVGPPTPGMRL